MYKENHQNERTYGVITVSWFLMKHGIINLHNHMHFFRYLDYLQSTVMFQFH